MERAARAEQANLRATERFVYREEIQRRETRSDGRVLIDSRSTYEMTMLAGESYHRLVAINGGPLTAEEEADELRRFRQAEHERSTTPLEERRRRYLAAESERFRIDTQDVLEHHEMRLVGEQQLGAEPVVVVEAWPRADAPRAKKRSEWSLAQRLRYSISRRTGRIVEVEAEQLYALKNSPKGARTRVVYTEMDGVSLLARIESHARRGVGRQAVDVETVQIYSDYRRFQSETVLLFDDAPPR
jgi:hypothetical protein